MRSIHLLRMDADATSEPTGTPGGACTMRGAICSAMPQRSNSLLSATPLGPVDRLMLGAASTAERTASSLSMLGSVAPAGTATATPEWTQSTLLQGSRWPAAMSLSMASDARITTSNISPADTRLAASTPPTDSMTVWMPDCCANPANRSASTWRVAMEEMPRRAGVVMGFVSCGMRGPGTAIARVVGAIVGSTRPNMKTTPPLPDISFLDRWYAAISENLGHGPQAD
jgi:hypothetical protein